MAQKKSTYDQRVRQRRRRETWIMVPKTSPWRHDTHQRQSPTRANSPEGGNGVRKRKTKKSLPSPENGITIPTTETVWKKLNHAIQGRFDRHSSFIKEK